MIGGILLAPTYDETRRGAETPGSAVIPESTRFLETPLLSKSFEVEAHTYVLRVAPIFCHESLFAKYFIQSLLPPFVPHKVGFPSN